MWIAHLVLSWVMSAFCKLTFFLPNWGQSVLFAALVGVLFVFLYSLISAQKLIKKVKRKIWASVFEAVLFQRSVAISFRAYSRMLLAGLGYLTLALLPMLILFVPSVVILSQGLAYLGSRGIQPQQVHIVRGNIGSQTDLQNLIVTSSPGLSVIATVRTKEGDFFTSIRATEVGEQRLNLQIGEHSVAELPVYVGSQVVRPISVTHQISFEDFLFGTNIWWKPSDPRISRLELSYPEISYRVPLLHFQLSWLTFVVIVLLISGYVFARLLKIEV